MNQFAKKLTQALEAAGIKHRSYSGRGMMGANCVGVTCGGSRDVSEGDVLEAVARVRGGLRPSRDSMGLGAIVYWPSASLDEPDEKLVNDGTHDHAADCIRRASPAAECSCYVAELPAEA